MRMREILAVAVVAALAAGCGHKKTPKEDDPPPFPLTSPQKTCDDYKFTPDSSTGLRSFAELAPTRAALLGPGNEVGNGGDVVVCRDAAGAIASVEMLDLFEGRTLRGLSVDPALDGGSFDEVVERIAARLHGVDPVLAN